MATTFGEFTSINAEDISTLDSNLAVVDGYIAYRGTKTPLCTTPLYYRKTADNSLIAITCEPKGYGYNRTNSASYLEGSFETEKLSKIVSEKEQEPSSSSHSYPNMPNMKLVTLPVTKDTLVDAGDRYGGEGNKILLIDNRAEIAAYIAYRPYFAEKDSDGNLSYEIDESKTYKELTNYKVLPTQESMPVNAITWFINKQGELEPIWQFPKRANEMYDFSPVSNGEKSVVKYLATGLYNRADGGNATIDFEINHDRFEWMHLITPSGIKTRFVLITRGIFANGENDLQGHICKLKDSRELLYLCSYSHTKDNYADWDGSIGLISDL